METTRARVVDWIDGAVNLRDFGGYRTDDGNRVRHGLLFRSGSTHGISNSGLARIADELRIRTVFDLRTERERERGLSRFEQYGVRVLQEPLDPVNGINPGALSAEMLRRLTSSDFDWVELYWSLVQHNGPRLARIVQSLAEPEALPVLIHCTGGRDRTGITVALIQAVLGISDDDIAEDYALSGALLERTPAAEFERLLVRNGLSREDVARVVLTRPVTMRSLLSRIRDAFGDVRCLLRQCGVDDDTVERLRAAVTEP